jgi:hypothetical protein
MDTGVTRGLCLGDYPHADAINQLGTKPLMSMLDRIGVWPMLQQTNDTSALSLSQTLINIFTISPWLQHIRWEFALST